MIAICYHEDFTDGRGFARRSDLSDFLFHRGYQRTYFPDSASWMGWSPRQIPEQLELFDDVTNGDEAILIGASDGGTMAAHIACYRSTKVKRLIGYSSRLWDIDIRTERKFPVTIVSNGREWRRHSKQHARLITAFKLEGHEVVDSVLPNNWSHFGTWGKWGTWDSRQNELIWSLQTCI